MTIPATIQVGPYRYSVVVDEAAINKASIEFGHHVCGHADHCAGVFTIAPNLSPGKTAEVLLHEVVHAIDNASGMPALKEFQVSQISVSLLDTMRRNPELVDFLMEREAKS
ncbi:MAG: hypothetical protein Q7O66_07460 [Dehalococcoidia bacterium]|nr:hypothetical protein [Dehalococcoidia bacterium]